MLTLLFHLHAHASSKWIGMMMVPCSCFTALLCAHHARILLKYSKAFKLFEIWVVTSQVGSVSVAYPSIYCTANAQVRLVSRRKDL